MPDNTRINYYRKVITMLIDKYEANMKKMNEIITELLEENIKMEEQIKALKSAKSPAHKIIDKKI